MKWHKISQKKKKNHTEKGAIPLKTVFVLIKSCRCVVQTEACSPIFSQTAVITKINDTKRCGC